MKRMNAVSGASEEHDHDAGGWHPAPGKRTLTQGLQLRAESAPIGALVAPPTASEPAAASAAHEDPFGLHLAASAGVSGGGGTVPHADVIQPLMPGLDLASVRAHRGDDTDRALGELGAQAYATGNDIALPAAPSVHLVAHELAHVAQQRRGVSLKGGIGEAGDPYEAEADAIADRVAAGRSAADLMPASGGGGGGGGGATVQRKPDVTTRMDVKLVGHASPRWEVAHSKDRSKLNMNLSHERAASVEKTFGRLLTEHLAVRGHRAQIPIQCTGVNEEGAIEMEREGRGSNDTIDEAKGDPKANAASMRRVNIKVTLTDHIKDVAETMRTEKKHAPRVCEPYATQDWSMQLLLSGGAGHAGPGVTGGVARLRNNVMKSRTSLDPDEKAIVTCTFGGVGVGVGLSTPGIDPTGNWTDFKTDRLCSFKDFDGVWARFTQAGGGFALGGAGLTYLTFESLGASINLSGINMGQLGLDASTNRVRWWVSDTIPEPRCSTARDVYHDVIDKEPFELDRTRTPFEHDVRFDTQSATISEKELAFLDSFAEIIAEAYAWQDT